MDKELIDRVWKILPKEFKEEVKRMWSVEVDCATKYKSELHKYRTGLLYELFGEHLYWQNNLTSDAEGEEMLTVSRTKIEALHSEIHKAIMDAHDADDWQDAAHYILDILPRSFNALFGSKCLPDEKVSDCHHLQEPKPAEPKFKGGDLALYLKKSIVRIIEYHHEQQKYYVHRSLDNLKFPADESDLEPYTEPKEDHFVVNNEMVKDFDTIIKDGFSKVRRLNIATQMASAYIIREGMAAPAIIATMAFQLADALIKEAEKGGES